MSTTTAKLTPPDPIKLYQARIKNSSDIAALWVLTRRGAAGTRVPEIARQMGTTTTNVYRPLSRLAELKLAIEHADMDAPGHPITWKATVRGYRLMTEHMALEG